VGIVDCPVAVVVVMVAMEIEDTAVVGGIVVDTAVAGGIRFLAVANPVLLTRFGLVVAVIGILT
jgi:hypothetical protein